MNRILKRMMLLMALLSLVLVSCAEVPSSLRKTDSDRKVSMIVKMNSGSFWNTVKMGAEVAAKEYNVELTFTGPDSENDIEGQITLVEDAIQNKADAIILSASDYMRLAQVTDTASHHKIPVISMDTEVASARVKSFVGTNNYEAGQKAAERLIELIGGRGQVGLVSFVEGARNANERASGMLDYLARFPNIDVVDLVYCGSDVQLAAELTHDMLIQYPDLSGIIALNEVAGIGVSQEIQRLSLGGEVKIITFDSPPEVIEMIQEGIVQATVIQNPFSNGYLAVKHAVDAIEGIQVPERDDTGSKLVDLDNMLWPENQKQLFPFVK
ncbi:substrate-binding domain-containing protein [Paenibacillus crassostreae]|uniref:LacI family transcriptional regulator n=1 Tax=Paenibacillus crassostreae TaxID=1763538 RepID=A0A167DMW5_9BACL|nr:substrate-binding domain-containing protein [Paenibacillus crassostreae]AOZ91268.1 LacI family transcriptional regulator [Paenibacillus crassostreae]OAB74572.1 LacI family transcriptional regulator [Paenibacillus crassostreae]